MLDDFYQKLIAFCSELIEADVEWGIEWDKKIGANWPWLEMEFTTSQLRLEELQAIEAKFKTFIKNNGGAFERMVIYCKKDLEIHNGAALMIRVVLTYREDWDYKNKCRKNSEQK